MSDSVVRGTIVDVEDSSIETEVTVECEDNETFTDTFGKVVAHQVTDFNHQYGFYPSGAKGKSVVVFTGNSYNSRHEYFQNPSERSAEIH